MSSCIYPIINIILFGIVFLEVLFQIGFSFFNKQKLKSHYFLFLIFSAIWTVLRGVLSIPSVYSNPRVLDSILDFIYPSIICSFLILSRYYITIIYQKDENKAKILKQVWNWIVLIEYLLFAIFAGLEWTSIAHSLGIHLLKEIGMGIPFIIACLQLYVTVYYHTSVTNIKSKRTLLCEVILNILILVHFAIDLLNILHILHLYYSPNNLIDILYAFFLEVIPINLLLLIVHDFDIRMFISSLFTLIISIVHAEDIPVPDNLIAEYLKQDIVISNPLLDYAYSRQDIENMVIATSRSHKDSEEYNITVEEAITNRSSIDRYNSLDKNVSPSDSIGSPLTF